MRINAKLSPEKQNSILIVENDDNVRKLLLGKLANKGYVCYEATRSEQVIDRVKGKGITLVILDTEAQGTSTADLLSTIKAIHPYTAIVVATPVGGTSIGIECTRLGADEYITKPFILEEVVLTVDKVIEKRRLENLKEQYQQYLQDTVGEQTEIIRKSFFQAITALVHALEAKDRYTSGHSQRVAGISAAIGSKLLLPVERIEKIRMAGLVHDIGKIGIKEFVLNKPEGLTDEELKQVQHHPEIGEYILTPIVSDSEILRLVRHHHEHYDGTGYPDGLAGAQIPLGSRILAAADAYDAMTSDRPYRKTMSSEVALAELERKKGIQFDPRVVDALLQINIEEVIAAINNSPASNY